MRRRSSLVALLSVAASLLFVGGCSPETADLFSDGPSGSGGGGAGATATTKSATSTSSNPPDTTGVTSAVSTTGSTNPDTVASSSSGGPVQTVSVQASSSSGPLGDFVDCGNAGQCKVDESSVCCWDDNDSNGQCTSADECALTATGQFLTAVHCQHPTDCPGQVCCGHKYFGDGGQVYEATSCTNTCQAPDVQLCDQNVPNICPFFTNGMGQQQQMFCKASTLLPTGYFVCSKTM